MDELRERVAVVVVCVEEEVGGDVAEGDSCDDDE